MENEDKCIALSSHAIGLDNHKPYKRHGKFFYKPYRNYYDASMKDSCTILWKWVWVLQRIWKCTLWKRLPYACLSWWCVWIRHQQETYKRIFWIYQRISIKTHQRYRISEKCGNVRKGKVQKCSNCVAVKHSGILYVERWTGNDTSFKLSKKR